MNHSFRVIWNVVTSTWQAVAETAIGRGKSKSIAKGLSVSSIVLAAATASAGGLPTGGSVVAGTGAISQSGSTMTINQSTSKMAVNWDSFSVGQGNTVNFVQPSTSAVALNRVVGSDVSVIQGAINANGQVFLLNPNGVLFTPTAQVNVGALVASTLKMSTDDFMAGNYKFSGDSSNAVINQGNITAVGDAGKGGAIALIAAKVINEGNLTANSGHVLLGAGSEVLLDLGGPVKLQVTQGAIDALVQNSGAIKADGGLIYLTAQAVNALTAATINNTGVIRAQTLATGEKGQILLIADMQSGTANVSGTLDASAPNGGDGGFIETSGAVVNTQSGLQVNAGSALGNGGTWLIDPYNYTIDSAAASTIVGSLNTGTSVTVSTSSNAGVGAGSAGAGDITVNSAIAKTAGGDATLTLQADRNITIDAAITSTFGKLNMVLSSANAASATVGGIKVNANLLSNGGNITMGGAYTTSAYTKDANGDPVSAGYALNYETGGVYGSAIQIGTGSGTASAPTLVYSDGGNITISGLSKTGSSSGSYNETKAGVTINSGTAILTNGGNLTVNGVSEGGIKTFGIAVPHSPSAPIFIGGAQWLSGSSVIAAPSTSAGKTFMNAWNATSGETTTNQDAGSLGLVAYGQTRDVFITGYSATDYAVNVNGSSKSIIFYPSASFPACKLNYCGYLVVPGGNNSYLYAGYQFVTMGGTVVGITVTTPDYAKTYDGTTSAPFAANNSNIVIGNDPGGFSTDWLTKLVFITSSPNVGTYSSLSSGTYTGGPNPTTYSYGGTSYPVNYIFGTYTINKAPLGIALTAIYNGSSTFNFVNSTGTSSVEVGNGTGTSDAGQSIYTTNTGAPVTAATIGVVGLQGTDKLTGVTVNSPNISANGSNYVTGLSGSASLSNYSVNLLTASNQQLSGGAADFVGTNFAVGNGTNAIRISPAPLGVAVSGVYNGTPTYINGVGGTSINTSGLVGGDAGKRVGTATLDSSSPSSTSYVRSITSSDFDVDNYILFGSRSAGSTGECAGGICSGTNNAGANAGGTNTVSIAVLQPPPAAPIIVPAFPDNGIKAIANDIRPPEFGGMNYVAALFEGEASNSPSNRAGQTQGNAPVTSATPVQAGAMNYVSITSKVTDAGQELQVRLPEDKNRKPQSELNVNNTTVSSNTSPLDVFVVDTGINLRDLIKMNNGK